MRARRGRGSCRRSATAAATTTCVCPSRAHRSRCAPTSTPAAFRRCPSIPSGFSSATPSPPASREPSSSFSRCSWPRTSCACGPRASSSRRSSIPSSSRRSSSTRARSASRPSSSSPPSSRHAAPSPRSARASSIAWAALAGFALFLGLWTKLVFAWWLPAAAAFALAEARSLEGGWRRGLRPSPWSRRLPAWPRSSSPRSSCWPRWTATGGPTPTFSARGSSRRTPSAPSPRPAGSCRT